MNKYYDVWQNYEDAKKDYSQLPPEEDIIYAGYTYEDYNGAALVVFKKDGKIYENNDGHCSCYGLEDWRPEETSIEALRMRKGWPGLHEALEQVSEA
jgi:hypothetical protein